MDKRWIWPFELEEQIGKGGMGVVYRARYVKNDRKVALKLLPKEIATNATIAARFEREMEILKDLKHPNIVNCFGGTAEGDYRFYAMELIEGGTMDSLLMDRGRLSWGQVVEYTQPVCSALAYAHARGIIHRDIKPANLLLTRSGKVKLSDFGLALVAGDNKLTAAGKTMGTMHYMAPEQIRGSPPLSGQSDLYALGCVMFEMLTGKPPFSGETPAEILHQHLEKTAPRVATIAMDCPRGLDSLISDMLEKDPERRPKGAEDVLRRLQSVDEVIVVKSKRGLEDGDRPSDAPTNKKKRKVEGKGAERAENLANRPPVEGTHTTSTFNTILTAIACLLITLMAITFFDVDDAKRFSIVEGQLKEMLKAPQPQVRQAAAHAIGELGPGGANCVRDLAKLLTPAEKDVNVHQEVLNSLEKIGYASRPILLDLQKLQNEAEMRPHIRELAMRVHKVIQEAPEPGSKLPLYRTVLGIGVCACVFIAWLRRPIAH